MTYLFFVLGFMLLQFDSVATAAVSSGPTSIWEYMMLCVAGAAMHILKKLGEMPADEFKVYIKNAQNLIKTISGIGICCLMVYMMFDSGQITVTAAIAIGFGVESAASSLKQKTGGGK